MSEEFVYNKEKISFREIVLAHLKRILELSSVEFRGGYHRTVFVGSSSHTEYVPSSKKSYIQSVEHFAFALFPHFDKEMKKDFETYEENIENFFKGLDDERRERLIESYNFAVKKAKAKGIQPPLQIELEEQLRKKITIGEDEEREFINYKLNQAQKLFINLNKLLSRIDYLKTSVYSESDLDDEDLDTKVQDIDGREAE